MSENSISISNLNDFIFCPASIYFHSLDNDTENLTYQTSSQLEGKTVHEKVDTASYSTDKFILQGISVYSDKYDLYGKIDVFDMKAGLLRERKKKIHVVYDGYIFQLYAQCHSLREMGYTVNKLALYSFDDNRTYPISLPEEDNIMQEKFEKLIKEIKEFSFDNFAQENCQKCRRCIYEPLCPFSKCKEEMHADST